MEEKYKTKQEPKYKGIVNSENSIVKQSINSANCFGMSPEASQSMLEANEQAKQMAQK